MRKSYRPFSVWRAVALLPLLVAGPVHAATFTVDSTFDAVDTAPGDGVCADSEGRCTLRAAVMETNALPGADEIDLPAGNYPLGIPGPDELDALTGDLNVRGELAIRGGGGASTSVDGSNLDRVFACDSCTRLSLADLTVTGGNAPGGGGILSFGGLSLTGVTVSGNTATGGFGGGGIGIVFGGGEVRLRRTTISGNHAQAPGGGGMSVLLVMPSVDTLIEVLDSVIYGNTTSGDGGGVLVWYYGSPPSQAARLVRTTVSGNVANGAGGGIALAYGTGQLAIYDAVVEANQSQDGAGGIAVSYGPKLTIEKSTVANNVGASAGAIEVRGGDAVVSNSTLSGNTGDISGALLNQLGYLGYWGGQWPGSTSLADTTVSANRGDAIVSGLGPFEKLAMTRTIVAQQLIGADCAGTMISDGYNVDSDGTCGLTDPTDLPNIDPLLGPLQDNGGPTWTHALLPGSPAIDAIPLADCTWDDDGDPGTPEVPVERDQRGVLRAQGAACDIGAYEVHPEVDTDEDGVDDALDNCTDIENPEQRDTDRDWYGNICDCDFDNTVRCNASDFNLFLPDFALGADSGIGTDMTGDEVVNADDFNWFLPGFAEGEPGPSGLVREDIACGLGFELALILPGLMWLRRRRDGIAH